METYSIDSHNAALRALATVSHGARLRIVRLLSEADDHTLPAGEIGARMGLPAASLSFHLKELARSGLVSSRRRGRFILYRVEPTAVRALLGYLANALAAAARGPTADDDGKTLPGVRSAAREPKPNVRPKLPA